MQDIKLNVEGMMCGGCEKRVENAIKQIDGVIEVTANHENKNVDIKLDKDISIEKIKEIIEDLGYDVV